MAPHDFLVLERPDEGLSAALHRWLGRHPLPMGERLVLLSPGWEPAPGTPLPPCALLLLPSGREELAARFPAACAVSYGTGGRDSLTLSSVEGQQLAVAVQRELPTVLGGAVEEQELVLERRGSASPLSALALVGGLLLLGAAPERLMEDPPEICEKSKFSS